MKKLYGDSLRKDAGFVKVIKHVASKNARLLGRGAQRHAPELGRVVKEVKGTFEKVYEETAEVVEEFLAKCECRDLVVMGRRLIVKRSQPVRKYRRWWRIRSSCCSSRGKGL